MPRLTPSQASALADWWTLAQHAGYGGYTATDTTTAASDIARQYGRSLAFTESQAIGVLYGYARRMSNAADTVQSALDSDVIGADHMTAAPWARDEQVMNTVPIWHVIYDFTYIDADGITQTDKKTSVIDMNFPYTIGDLKDAIAEDAQVLASKYQVAFVDAALLEIQAV